MTNEEAFKISADGLLRQGRKSTGLDNEKTFCRYRGRDNKKCAVGFLIPDEEYRESMECLGLTQIRALDGIDIRLLQDLQRVHDSREPEDWVEVLKEIAVHYGFNWAPPQAEEVGT